MESARQSTRWTGRRCDAVQSRAGSNFAGRKSRSEPTNTRALDTMRLVMAWGWLKVDGAANVLRGRFSIRERSCVRYETHRASCVYPGDLVERCGRVGLGLKVCEGRRLQEWDMTAEGGPIHRPRVTTGPCTIRLLFLNEEMRM